MKIGKLGYAGAPKPTGYGAADRIQKEKMQEGRKILGKIDNLAPGNPYARKLLQTWNKDPHSLRYLANGGTEVQETISGLIQNNRKLPDNLSTLEKAAEYINGVRVPDYHPAAWMIDRAGVWFGGLSNTKVYPTNWLKDAATN